MEIITVYWITWTILKKEDNFSSEMYCMINAFAKYIKNPFAKCANLNAKTKTHVINVNVSLRVAMK